MTAFGILAGLCLGILLWNVVRYVMHERPARKIDEKFGSRTWEAEIRKRLGL